ncbi:class I SAM-dependent methyltransferase [Ideonella alba]|nr:class I SAM-dependent methyltransferase [Ideonella alba]
MSDAGFATPETMRDYYAQRAQEYELVYHKPHRQPALRRIEAWLREVFADRCVLEIASGTGWWVPHAAAQARAWWATDLNPETLAVAQAKALPACVRFAQVDAYTLQGLPQARFDACFAGCWWSHVPLQRLDAWLATVHAALPAGSRVVMLDNAYVEGDSTPVTRHDDHGNGYQRRQLRDGSEHEVLKNFPSQAEVIARLGPRAEAVVWHDLGHYWAVDYRLR